MSSKQSGERNNNAKLTEASVRDILAARESGDTYRQIAKRFGICEQHAFRIIKGIQWKHMNGGLQ